MKKYDIVALGELLIDFTQAGYSPDGMRLFEQNPGGAVANVLAAAAKFRRSTAFIGKVGKDMHGAFLKKNLADSGIDVKNLVEDKDVFTTLAFVELSESGERSFSFARKPGADTMLREDEMDTAILENTRIFHVGSLSLTDEPARSTTLAAIKIAKAAGAIISYDPNYRASLWHSVDEAKEQMRSLIPYADMMKISDEETELVTGYARPEDAARYLNAQGVKLAAISLGAKGVLIGIGGDSCTVPAFSVEAVDTTGAGDAFWGGFLHSFINSGVALEDITLDLAKSWAVWGCATAALCITKRGAIPAMPAKQDVETLIATT